jgi:hypothetical protein
VERNRRKYTVQVWGKNIEASQNSPGEYLDSGGINQTTKAEYLKTKNFVIYIGHRLSLGCMSLGGYDAPGLWIR